MVLRHQGVKVEATPLLPCFAWLSVAALLAYVVPELRGNVNTMEELDMYLCGGNFDFVRTTTSTGLIVVKKTEAYNGDLVSTYETNLLEEAVSIHDLTNVSLSWFAPSDSWFSLSQSLTTVESASYLPYCFDMWDGSLYASFLKAELGLDSFDCRNVSNLCAASNSSSLRAACPVTCGCAHPQSSLYLNGALYACPPVCKEHEQYKVALEKISCSTSDVLDHPNWTDFVRNMAVYNEELGAIQEQMRDNLLAYGCEAVQWYQALLCQNTLTTSGFALWCPVECGCRVPNGFYDTTCPPGCEQWRSKYEESLAHLPCEDASALEFTSGSSRTFLDLHIATFQHASGIYDSEDSVRWQLTTYGCGGLPQEWCGFARGLRAVCPVICGTSVRVRGPAFPPSFVASCYFYLFLVIRFVRNTAGPSTTDMKIEPLKKFMTCSRLGRKG